MKLTVGISGASGVNLALKFIKQIPKDIEIFVVFSKSSKKALKLENGIKTKRSLRSVRQEMLSLAEMLKQN